MQTLPDVRSPVQTPSKIRVLLVEDSPVVQKVRTYARVYLRIKTNRNQYSRKHQKNYFTPPTRNKKLFCFSSSNKNYQKLFVL